MDFTYHFQVGPVPHGERSSGPFSDAGHRKHRRTWKWRRKKGAGGMAQMMLGKKQTPVPVQIVIELLELPHQQPPLEQLLLQPQRQGLSERSETVRRKGEVGLKQTLEFQERFVVERHHVQLVWAGAGGFQARADRLMRESRIVLLAGEAFLLGSSDDLPVIHQRGRAVVVISG